MKIAPSTQPLHRLARAGRERQIVTHLRLMWIWGHVLIFVPSHPRFFSSLSSLDPWPACRQSRGAALQCVTFSTTNFSTFSELAFRLTLTPASALITIGRTLGFRPPHILIAFLVESLAMGGRAGSSAGPALRCSSL
jgi:hypothetical protein